jgi:hypothetical protein
VEGTVLHVFMDGAVCVSSKAQRVCALMSLCFMCASKVLW